MPNTLGVQRLSERLRWARETAGLTTRQLADAAHVARGYPSAIECEQFKKPSLAALQRLSETLEVTFDWLAFGRGKKPSPRVLRRVGSTIKGRLAA